MTIRDFFDEAVAKCGEKVFLRWHEGAAWRTLTYAETRVRVVRMLAALLEAGMATEARGGFRPRVAIVAENAPDWMVAYLALAGCGQIAVPVDPKFTADESAYVLGDCGAERVVRADFFARLASVSDAFVSVAEAFWRANRPSEADVASIVYTSGTTGRPKGAMLTHGNFTANVDQTFSRVRFYGTDHFLLALPLFHVFAFTLSFLLPLRKGGQISFARSMRSVPLDMAELKPTVFMAVPLLAELLYARARSIVCSLRMLGVGGAPISVATLTGLREAGVYVLEGYGITECAPGVSYPDETRYVPGTVGFPLDGMEWRIVHSDETGAGELRVKGPNVMKGYWNNPEATAQAFDAEGFYRTGDVVRPVLNGNFTICGRTKALIVNREGKNIYPEEIERLVGRLPFVRDVLVLGYRTGSEVGERVGAIVVPEPEAAQAAFGADVQGEALADSVRRAVQSACRAALAEYKLPRKIDVRFVPLERTPSMKVKRYLYARALDE